MTFCTPRSYFSQPWRPLVSSLEVIGFGDASEDAYGAVVYLRVTTQEGYKVSFANAHTRVVPLKKIILPRLELLAALLAARLVLFVKESIQIIDVPKYLYSDSLISLSWIRGNPSNFKTWVSNRISKITEISLINQWYFCAGIHNPADLASRGCLGDNLINHPMWLNGPEWLYKYKFYPQPEGVSLKLPMGVNPECKGTVCMSIQIDSDFEFSRISKFPKIVNSLAYILRFIKNYRYKEMKSTGPLSRDETVAATTLLWKLQQRRVYSVEVQRLQLGKPIQKDSKILKLSPHLDPKGVLRITGRLQQSLLTYEMKHPIILPQNNVSLVLIRHLHIITNHAGIDSVVSHLRENYWVINARRLAKTVIRFCVPCQKLIKGH